MVHCLACVIIGEWGKLYGLVDNLACMLDVVMDVVACTFVDNKVRHVEAVLSPCGGDVWEWKVRYVEAVLPPCGGGIVILVIIYVWYSNCVCVLGEWFTLYGFSRVPLWTCMGKGLHVGGRGHRG